MSPTPNASRDPEPQRRSVLGIFLKVIFWIGVGVFLLGLLFFGTCLLLVR